MPLQATARGLHRSGGLSRCLSGNCSDLCPSVDGSRSSQLPSASAYIQAFPAATTSPPPSRTEMLELPTDFLLHFCAVGGVAWRTQTVREVINNKLVCKRWRDASPRAAVPVRAISDENSHTITITTHVGLTENPMHAFVFSDNPLHAYKSVTTRTLCAAGLKAFRALPPSERAPYEARVAALLAEPDFRERRWASEMWHDNNSPFHPSMRPSLLLTRLMDNDDTVGQTLNLSPDPFDGGHSRPGYGALDVGPEGAQRLSEALIRNTQVRALVLTQKSIEPEGTTHLAHMLRENKHLRVLDLNLTYIGDDGASEIAQALCVNSTLCDLKVGGINNLTGASAIEFAHTLKRNTNLRYLGLDFSMPMQLSVPDAFLSTAQHEAKHAHQEQNRRALRVLAGAIALNSSLTGLKLGHVHIGDDSAQVLSDALSANTTLQTLRLDWVGEARRASQYSEYKVILEYLKISQESAQYSFYVVI